MRIATSVAAVLAAVVLVAGGSALSQEAVDDGAGAHLGPAQGQAEVGDAVWQRRHLNAGGAAGDPCGPESLTESLDPITITEGNSVSCNAGALHTDNSYLRVFGRLCAGDANADDFVNVLDLIAVIEAWGSGDPNADVNDDGIVDVLDLITVILWWGDCPGQLLPEGPFEVCAVEFGIEIATSGDGVSQPAEVRLYAYDGSEPPTFAALGAPITVAAVDVPDQSLTLFTVDVSATVADGLALAVEIFTPDGQDAGNSFFIGSNANGQTGPTYLAAADCGVTEPTPTEDLPGGFPDMHMVMTVFGISQGFVSELPPTRDDS
jgi:hypothetical protein